MSTTIQVEGILYNIHRYFFERDSSIFRSTLESTPASNTGAPLVLPDITCSDFDEFLSILYPIDFCRPANKTTQQWASILLLADKWGFESIRLLAIDCLATAAPVDKIVLGRRYRIAAWLPGAYNAVCTREAPLTVEEGIRLGVEDVVRIAAARQAYGCGKPRFEKRHLAHDIWEIFGLERPAEEENDTDTGDEDEAIRALEVEVAYVQTAYAALQSPASMQCKYYAAPQYCGACSDCKESQEEAELQFKAGERLLLKIISDAGAEDKLAKAPKDGRPDAQPAFRPLVPPATNDCSDWEHPGHCDECANCKNRMKSDERQLTIWREERAEKMRRLKGLKDQRQQRRQELADRQERKSMFRC
ncbi:hypothetical protein HWV62_43178 [Athelia sp. TMB]|nr:hypothetical protein HWV62_43178 [Athelia sp. TMB]